MPFLPPSCRFPPLYIGQVKTTYRGSNRPLSPLEQVQESACEKLRCAEQGWLMYTLIRNHAGKAFFEHPRPLRVFENAVFAPLLQVPCPSG
jgi:hypothetical protein